MPGNDKQYSLSSGYRIRDLCGFTYHRLSLAIRAGSLDDFFRDVGVAGSNPVTPTIDSTVLPGRMVPTAFRYANEQPPKVADTDFESCKS